MAGFECGAAVLDALVARALSLEADTVSSPRTAHFSTATLLSKHLSMSASNTGTGSRESTQHRLKTRPTSSAVLWGHLLASSDVSKTASQSGRHETRSSAPISTIAPVDKTGTSLRILLHDTQANLEKFSERVGKLTGDIDESKREIGTVKTLLQQDHEKTVEEIVDLGEWPA